MRQKDELQAEKKDTKEVFLLEALRLFAQKGYEAVTVAQIAKAVNVSAPALYKHYKSKEELFHAILDYSDAEFAKRMNQMRVAYEDNDDTRKNILKFSEDEQIDSLVTVFKQTLHSEYPAMLRKLMQVEQYHMPELAKKLNERYVFHQYHAYENLFKLLMEQGVIKQGDPKTLAITYVTPAILMIEVCDRTPEYEEEAIQIIVNHIKEFNKNYRIK